jgi:hypothetical protein
MSEERVKIGHRQLSAVSFLQDGSDYRADG